MKLIQESIDVAYREMRPYMICWRSGTYTIEQIIDTWNSRGPWWGKDEQRGYILLITSSGVMEIYHSNIQGWMLSRMYD
jgi:hypothetical protein